MIRRGKYCASLLALVVFFLGGHALAEPYFAVRYGLKCEACHVNPTGGGLRTDFGDVFSQTTLPAHTISTDKGLWTGAVTNWLRIGGNLRYDADFTQTPGAQHTARSLEIEQGRLYAEAEPIANRLIFYVDEQMTPGPGDPINREAYAILWSAAHDWYIKAGRMYLPFGFRFQDQTAFVYDVSSITMYAPDNGLELGWLRGHWDAQVTLSNATAAGALPSTNGKEYGLQASYVESGWRLGVAAHDDDSPYARRKIFGVFGGTRTGPVTWLAEVDSVENEYAPVAGTTEAAMLVEADWLVARGNNLKVTLERLDPDRDVHDNERTRVSLVYELTPVQFLQLRAGVRDYYGPRDIPSQRATLFFFELHGFF